MRDNDVDVAKAIDDINSLVDKAYMPREYDELKEAMKKAFARLKRHEAEAMAEICQEIRQEGQAANKGWQIYVLLVPRFEQEKWASRGFFPILEDEEPQAEIGFLDCSLEEAEKLVEESPGLKWYDRYLEAEPMVFRAAAMNQMDLPVLFSPWARRSVELVSEDISPQAEQVLQRDCLLMWNICFQTATADVEIRPDGDDINYIYKYSKMENGFLLTEDAEAEIISLEDGRLQLAVPHKLLDYKVKWLQYKPIGEEKQEYIRQLGDRAFASFQPAAREGRLIHRIVTQGDLAYLLSTTLACNIAGEELKAEYHGIAIGEGFRPVKGYSRQQLHYAYDNEENLLYRQKRSLPRCYIKFAGGHKWLADYAEYVLAYLKHHYPEQQWIGVSP